MLLVSLTDVEFGYSDVPCLQDASIDIFSGEFVAVTGPNGASKTTLLKLALGLLQPWKGKVELSPHNTEGQKLVVGYVSQQIAAFNGGFPSTILEFVRSGRYVRGSWFRRLRPLIMSLRSRHCGRLGCGSCAIAKSVSFPADRSSGFVSQEHWLSSLICSSLMSRRQEWIKPAG